jgi:hypothetical protein
MGLRFAAICGVGAVLLLGRASAQEPKYWPNEKISFPIDTDKLAALDPKPAKLRFYAAPPKGKFELVAERRIDDLEEIVDPGSKAVRRGFNYKARGDGLEEFALQYVYGNGDIVPVNSALTPQFRIAFDTRPPLVRAVATASNTVSWTVEDENLLTDSVRVDVKYPNLQEWSPVAVRSFGTKDSYTWKEIPSGKVLEVRVTAKDKAGHLGQSNIVRIPTANVGAIDGGLSGDPLRSTPGGRVGTGFGGTDEFPNRPQIEYVKSSDLNVKSKLTRVTRSGVKEAILWVNDGKGGWKEESRLKVAIEANAKDPAVDMPYKAPKDGLYGFIVLPVSGAGYKPDDPRDGDAAQWLVEVDTTPPTIEIRTIRVGPGGLSGPRVEIDWSATDKNLMPEPITLEYAKDATSPDKDWKVIAAKIPNSSRYVWEVDDKELWKFYVRATCVDKANNSARSVYKDAVMVDLEKPSAVIEKVNGGAAIPPVNRNFRSPEPMNETPMIVPPMVPVAQPPLPAPAPVPMPKVEPTPVPVPPVAVPKVEPKPLSPIEAPPLLPGAPEVPMLPKIPGAG